MKHTNEEIIAMGHGQALEIEKRGGKGAPIGKNDESPTEAAQRMAKAFPPLNPAQRDFLAPSCSSKQDDSLIPRPDARELYDIGSMSDDTLAYSTILTDDDNSSLNALFGA